MSNILIIANFVGKEEIGGRFVNLASLLNQKWNNIEVITSDFSHGDKKFKDFESPIYDFNITRIHEPGYESNISPLRLFSHKVWGKNVYKYIKSLKEKPDLIYCAIPSLTVAKLIGKYCYKNNIKFVTDIQDLWPEAFELLFKNKKLKKFIFKPFHKYANAAYKYSDLVIGVSETYKNRGLKATGKAKGLTVFLGNDINRFDKAKDNPSLKKNKDEFWIGYIGTLGYSYDIKCVIDAIALLQKSHHIKNINFIIMGGGPLKEEFQNYALSKNVLATFTGPLPYEEMVSNLCNCDIVVNPIVKGGAQSITNKVGDYAFSGKPVVNSQPNQEYRDLLEEYKCRINCEVGNASQMAEAIKHLYEEPQLREIMGNNGRRLGEEKFDRNKTYPLIVEAIEKLIM